MGVLDGLPGALLHVVDVEDENLFGVHALDGWQSRAASIEVAGIYHQTDVGPIGLFDDFPALFQGSHRAPTKAEELEGQLDIVRFGDFSQLSQHLHRFGLDFLACRAVLWRGTGHDHNFVAPQRPADLTQLLTAGLDALVLGRRAEGDKLDGIDADRPDPVLIEERRQVSRSVIGQILVHLGRPNLQGFEARLTCGGNVHWQVSFHGGCAVKSK